MAFGLIALISIDLVLYATIRTTLQGRVSDPNSYFVWLLVAEFAVLFLAAALGGFIARTNFVIPAMTYGGLEFLYGVYRGLQLANNPDPIKISELDYSVTPFVSLILLLVLAIAAAGSASGMKLAAMTNSGRAGPSETGA